MNYKFIIKAVISSFLLFYIIYDVELDDILNSIKSVDYVILMSAFLLHFVGLFLSSVRWSVLLKAQDIKIKLSYLYKSYLVATFFNHFLPSTIGGDSIRAYDSWKLGENKEKALAVVVLDRFLGLLTLLIFAIISMVFSPDLSNKISGLTFWIILLSIGAITIIWFIFSPPIMFFKNLKENKTGLISKIGGLLYKIDEAFSQFSNKKDKLIIGLFLSVLLQLNVVFYYYLISQALGLEVVFIDYFLIVPLTIFITMMPVSFNGVGLRENALFLFLAPFGVLQSQAIAFAWLEYGMLLVLGAIGGIIYVLRNNRDK